MSIADSKKNFPKPFDQLPNKGSPEQQTMARQLDTVRITDEDKLNLVKFGIGGLVLGSSQFLLLPQLPQKRTLSSVVKNDSEITIPLC